jgi:beta-glucosidase
LSAHQEALIAAVAAANPRTIVVMETGGAVITPWRDKVQGLVEAWYSGGQGGEAIARILYGEVNPSGRLPLTFADDVDQLPRPTPAGLNLNPLEPRKLWETKPFSAEYKEGSSVGYRWYLEKGFKPAFPFGFGLSYTTFRYSGLTVENSRSLRARLTITNSGSRAGRETAQLYLREAPGRKQQRLLGWAQADLQPGESKTVEITVDPRLLANWDTRSRKWKVDGGRYRLFAGPNAGAAVLETAVRLLPATMRP